MPARYRHSTSLAFLPRRRGCRSCVMSARAPVRSGAATRPGAEDILSVALDAGYGSHEAFTRAFRDQFGLTPEQVRAQGHLNNLTLVEAITMTATPLPDLAPPRFEMHDPMFLVGLLERYNCEATAGISGQWQRMGPYFGTISKQVGRFAYGVSF